MNLIKCVDFFNPTTITEEIHIIGCGAVGSTLAEMLTRMGCTNIHLYDFDIVTDHNLANQMFRDKDIGKTKCVALENILKDTNPNINLTLHPEGYIKNKTKLSGYVFLAVDNIELRTDICNENLSNMTIKAVFDFRMGLADGQHYAANWSDSTAKTKLLNSMDFTTKEAEENAPKNACGTKLNIISTVRAIVSFGITNFITFHKSYGTQYKSTIVLNVLDNTLITF